MNLLRVRVRSRQGLYSSRAISTKNAIRQLVYLTIFAALCVVHLLLPIEWGFPVIRIVGYPFTLTVLVSFISIGILYIESNGAIVKTFPRKYVPYQLLLACVFLISALIADDVQAALYVVLSYLVTFVLDFLIIYYLFKRGLRLKFVSVLCAVAFVAALLGIAEGLFRYYLPFYRNIFLNHDYESMSYAMTRSDFRVLGTLGNPLVYSTAMILVVPFATEIRRPFIRHLVIASLFVASFLTVSRTALLMWLVLGVGYLMIGKHRVRTAFTVGVILAALLLVVGILGQIGWESLSTWSSKFAFDDPTNPQFLNVTVRRDLFIWAFQRFFEKPSLMNILFGYGLKSTISAVLALDLGGGLSTLDNTYTTVLYESGILGLGVFIVMILNVLVGFRWARQKNLHWYGILSLLAASLTFMTLYNVTFTFVWVASVAALAVDNQTRGPFQKVHRGRSVSPNRASADDGTKYSANITGE